MENEHFSPLMSEKNPKIMEDHALNSRGDLGDGVVYKPTVSMDNIVMKQPQKYIGLTKEELQRYADDPFWKRLRWALLILFWLAWIAMFVAAIIIVAMSPKCPPKPVLKWWQRKVCYQLWTKSFQDSDADGLGDIQGIASRVNDLAKMKISSVWPVPLLDSSAGSGYDVVDFQNIDPKLGTMKDFDEMIQKIHKKELKFIMDMPLSTVSIEHPWFLNDSLEHYFKIKSHKPLSDKQIWSPKVDHQFGTRNYYLHWEGKPNYAILNWDSAEVRDEMKSVLEFWLNKGVDGFYFGLVDYLATEGEDDGKPNWPGIHSRLSELSQHIKNANTTSKEILLFSSIDLWHPERPDNFSLAAVVEGELDFVINSHLINATRDSNCSAECIYNELSLVNEFHNQYNKTWPMWELGSPYHSRIASRMRSRERGELMQMLLLMLPGSINVYYGDEIGMEDVYVNVNNTKDSRSAMQWDDSANAGFSSAAESKLQVSINKNYVTNNLKAQLDVNAPTTAKLFKRLAGIRNTDETFLFGPMKVGLTNDSLVTIVRTTTTGAPANYIGVLHFGNDETNSTLVYTYNITSVIQNATGVAKNDVTAVVMTTNAALRKDEDGYHVYEERGTVDPQHLTLKHNEGVLLKLKPQK